MIVKYTLIGIILMAVAAVSLYKVDELSKNSKDYLNSLETLVCDFIVIMFINNISGTYDMFCDTLIRMGNSKNQVCGMMIVLNIGFLLLNIVWIRSITYRNRELKINETVNIMRNKVKRNVEYKDIEGKKLLVVSNGGNIGYTILGNEAVSVSLSKTLPSCKYMISKHKLNSESSASLIEMKNFIILMNLVRGLIMGVTNILFIFFGQ